MASLTKTPKMDLTHPANNPHASQQRPVAVSIDKLSKTYPVLFERVKKFLRRPSKPPVEALHSVSFDVHEGEIFGLIGPNGAGKTTLAKIVATLVQPSFGTVTVKGYDSVDDDRAVRAQIGLATAEERSFYWRLTTEQNLMFFARLAGLRDSDARRRIIELLERLELIELATRRFGELSTGNKQRLALARSLLARPPVLLLDEPTRSLDPLAAARMRDLIRSLAGGDPPVSVLLTSHNLGEVEELCERVAIINHGRIRALDSPAKLRAVHKQTEVVKIVVRGKVSDELVRQLETRVTDFELVEGPRAIVISFTREGHDDSLDATLRLLHQTDAMVQDVTIERATLLDVLESYENEHSNDAKTQIHD
jgi:ABC-2 type transport system ATP-binding protein